MNQVIENENGTIEVKNVCVPKVIVKYKNNKEILSYDLNDLESVGVNKDEVIERAKYFLSCQSEANNVADSIMEIQSR